MTLDGKIATRSRLQQMDLRRNASRKSCIGFAAASMRSSSAAKRLSSTIRCSTGRVPQAPGSPAPVATRIVLDSMASLPSFSQLVRTGRQYPTLIAAGPEAPEKELRRLAAAGCEVLPFAAARRLRAADAASRRARPPPHDECAGRRRRKPRSARSSTPRQIDEVHVFIAPKLFGGQKARSPIRGAGVELIEQALDIDDAVCMVKGHDLYVHGRTRK